MQPLSVDSTATPVQHGYQPLNPSGQSTSLFLSSLVTKFRSLIRPRLTWQYLGSSAVVLYVVYCFVFNLPFFAHRLPEYTGPYDVGAIDIEAPLDEARLVHDAKFKKGINGGGNAFELDTVLFTIYYPTNPKTKSSKPKHYWIAKPIAATAEGYARVAHINNFFTNTLFTGAIGMLVGGITIPAKVDVNLVTEDVFAPPVRLDDGDDDNENESNSSVTAGNNTENDNKIPVIVFTHGMASSRTDYTQWAGELASRGYIVAAIEHRDGSCPGSVVTKQTDKKRTSSHTRLHFRRSDIQGDSLDDAGFKEAQLSYREAEIEETVKALRRINSGHGQEVYETNSRNEGINLQSWSARLQAETMILAGHSFGATGALRALKPGPSSQNLPFKGGIILDPGKSSGPLNDNISVPLLVVHSNSWSKSRSMFYGRPHFDTVRDLVLRNKEEGHHPSWFMTSLGTSHPSVTDAPLIEPLLLSWTTGAQIDVFEGVRQYVHVCEDFMVFLGTGRRQNLLAEKAEFPEYDEKFGWGKRKGQGDGNDWRRFWQVHVSS